MILIKNGKFFIEDKETDNPELIGLALMDEFENIKDPLGEFDVVLIHNKRISIKIEYVDPNIFNENPAIIPHKPLK